MLSLHAKPPVKAEELFNQIISHPGSYSQVCDVMELPSDLPLQAYEMMDFAGASFSKKNQASMAANREALVEVVRKRLAAIDFTKAGKEPGVDPAPEENQDGELYGCDPTTLNPLTLELIFQLQATEVLPQLLAVEGKLVKAIAKAKDDAKVKPPEVYGWFVGGSGAQEDWSEAQRERHNNLFQARVAQRDLVILMASLMREKTYQPFLGTSLEKAYAAGLKKAAKEHGILDLKKGEVVPGEINGREVRLDPVTNLFRLEYFSVSIPYTREIRDEVRAAAEKWVAEH